MFDWLKKFHKNIQTSSRVNCEVDFNETKISITPLYFIDIDEHEKFYARYVHVTSSECLPGILNSGLHPLENAKNRLLEYLEKVFPEDDVNILIEEIINANSSIANDAPLVNNRLDEEKNKKEVVSLLPLGEKNYLKSAMDNSINDGGEFFKAARRTINVLHGINAGPLYPNATAVVIVARHYFEQNQIKNYIGCNAIDFLRTYNKNDLTTNWDEYPMLPIHVGTIYKPEHIVNMKYEEYLAHPKGYISPEALERIEIIFPDYVS
jgi:hypothetical protein